MNRFFLIFLVAGLFSSNGYARCYGETPTQYGNPILIDISNELSAKNPVFEKTFYTQFPAASVNCNGNSKIEAYSPIGNKKLRLGFDKGARWVEMSIVGSSPEQSIPAGTHSSGEFNTPVTLRFTLVPRGGGDQVVAEEGQDTLNINDVAIARDTTSGGMGFFEWLGKFLRYVGSFFTYWPKDFQDMFAQNIIVKYTPRMTTCTFNNAGLMVNLPKIGVAQLTKIPQPGYTPFTLNFSCNNLLANGSTDRAIDMFLSSNNLLPSDNSVLMDSTPGSAKGVGIKVAKRDTPNAPVVFSTSTLNRGSATSIFSAAAGAVVNSNFSVGMGAYYFPYNPAQLTSGEVRATATLNIVYQ